MSYFKVIFFLILFSSISSASMLYNKTNICIEDFYIKDSKIYYFSSGNNVWYSSTSTNTVAQIYPNYIYDSTDNSCRPNQSYLLGMSIEDFNFLLGLIGVIFGGIFMFFTVQAFTTVGGKK